MAVTDRLIANTKHPLRHPWPTDCYVQGGGDNPYRSAAFVEAYPASPSTYIRADGATMVEAEDKAWAAYLRYSACTAHDFEARTYKNGCGFCRHCGMFASNVLPVEQFCASCGERTNYFAREDAWYCESHQQDAPPSKYAWEREMEEEEARNPGAAAAAMAAVTDEDIAAVLTSLAAAGKGLTD